MTREEAIENLKGLLESNYVDSFEDAENEALRMAIKALKQEQSGDAISRQAALVSIKNLYPDMPVVDIMNTRRKWLEKFAPYFECENAIEQLPSVNPQEPKAGHWESFDLTYGRDIYKCSVCKCTTDVPTVLGIPMFKYCPNCGAKMVESKDSVFDNRKTT